MPWKANVSVSNGTPDKHMLKFLVIAVAAYVLYRLFTNDRKKKATNDAKEKERLLANGEMVKDPVCGAYIDADSTISVRDGEKVHKFCSYDCRDKFLRLKGKLPENKD